MGTYAKIKQMSQVRDLKEHTLLEGFCYFYSFFFAPNESLKYLLQSDNLVIYFNKSKSDGTNVINTGNLENIPKGWVELPYEAFVKKISLE